MNSFGSRLCKILFKSLCDRYLMKRVSGTENIPDKNFILAANHQSHLDQVATGYVCVPRPYHYIGQTDRYTGTDRMLMYFLYFLTGVIRVNRKNKESKEKAVNKAIEVLKMGRCLVIYPEGTRSRTGNLQEGRYGVAKIFLNTGVPILPVGIKGTFDLMPPGRGWPKFEKKVEISVGRPLCFKEELAKAKGLNEESAEFQELCIKITDRTMEEIAALLKEKK